jgi:hypothetical protein
MEHLRSDYDRIQDPATKDPSLAPGRPFGEDEPVFILRARDVTAPDTLRHWAMRVARAGASPNLVSAAEEWADRMEAWGREHGTKVPDTPHELLKL